MECKICSVELTEDTQYPSQIRLNSKVCKSCKSNELKEKRRQAKFRAIEYKGGKCENCGGEFHPAIFDFHHVNPEEKDVDPWIIKDWAWDRQKVELDKCVLLCSNCHRLEHYKD